MTEEKNTTPLHGSNVAREQIPAACKWHVSDIYAGENEKNPVLGIKTYYEQQWLDRGLTIKYIAFRPAAGKVLIEPEINIEPDIYRSFKRFRRQQ